MNPRDFDDTRRKSPKFNGKFNGGKTGEYRARTGTIPNGRWPANLVHDGSDEVVGMFPVTGAAKSGQRNPNGKFNTNAFGDYGAMPGIISGHDDNGGSAARFFYCAKASKKERGEGNTHPTVKSIALMEWLIKLVTPEGALIVDPFAGSGTTLIAAKNLGRQYIGGDITAEYVEIARKRLTT